MIAAKKKYKAKAYCELSEEERFKAKCRSNSRIYLTRGKITRQPCNLCGSEKSQMHHHDYAKPLEVTWLCRDCHNATHGLVPGGKSTCARCDDPRVPGSAYCRTHHNARSNQYQRNTRAELKRLRAIVAGTERA